MLGAERSPVKKKSILSNLGFHLRLTRDVFDVKFRLRDSLKKLKMDLTELLFSIKKYFLSLVGYVKDTFH